MPDDQTFETGAKVVKVDNTLGLVIGYAIVCTENGEPYFDLAGDHIPDDAMMKAATDFMLNSRMAKAMHEGDEAGSVVFAWPMTQEIADGFGLVVEKTGFMIAMKPNAEMLAKFADGTYTGFSIGGLRGEDEVVE